MLVSHSNSNLVSTRSTSLQTVFTRLPGIKLFRERPLTFWLLLALFSGFLAYIARMTGITHDAFHEMSLFREALIRGSLPQEDLFAYTPTVSPSIHHEWGTGAVLYWVTMSSGMGMLGIAILKYALVALLWFFIYQVARARGAHPHVFAILAAVCFPFFWVGFATVRAQLFTLVFLAAQLWLQELDWRGRRWWVLLWLVMLVAWLNLHAGFVVGVGLIAFHSCERFVAAWWPNRSLRDAIASTWHLILTAPAAVLALQLNPYGWQYVTYLVRAISMPRPLIAEWQPLWKTHSPELTLFMFALAVFLFAYSQRKLSNRSRPGATFLALSIFMALKHIRHGSLLGVVWLAYVPAWITGTPLGRSIVRWAGQHPIATIRLSQFAIVASLLFFSCQHFGLPSLPQEPLYSEACYPVGAIEYLKKHDFTGNLLTPFHAGAYVSWTAYPKIKVSLDGRYEVAYEEHVVPEHKDFFHGVEGWWKLLDKYNTDVALINTNAGVADKIRSAFGPRSASAASEIPTRQPWRIVYEDKSYFLLAAESCDLPTSSNLHQFPANAAWNVFAFDKSHRSRKQKLVAESGDVEPNRISSTVHRTSFGNEANHTID